MKLIKPIARDGQIMKAFDLAFSPDGNADEVVTWLRSRLYHDWPYSPKALAEA